MVDWSNVRVRELRVAGRPGKHEPFALLPLAWAAKAAAATDCVRAMVWIWLVQRARKTGTDTVVMSNEALAKYGVKRKTKDLALQRLESAGLVAVERRRGKAPLVKVLL